jgi:hypothetical protein
MSFRSIANVSACRPEGDIATEWSPDRQEISVTRIASLTILLKMGMAKITTEAVNPGQNPDSSRTLPAKV